MIEHSTDKAVQVIEQPKGKIPLHGCNTLASRLVVFVPCHVPRHFRVQGPVRTAPRPPHPSMFLTRWTFTDTASGVPQAERTMSPISAASRLVVAFCGIDKGLSGELILSGP